MPTAVRMIREIVDVNARKQISNKIKGLANSPDQQGTDLVDELAGYRRIPAAGRYRVIYSVTRDDGGEGYEGTVRVVAAGIRKDGDKRDIYRILTRLATRGEL